MFISTKKYDEVNARNVELARQVRELNEESEYLHSENRDLRYENTEHKDTFKEIISLAESNNYNRPDIILNKIKELAQRSNQN